MALASHAEKRGHVARPELVADPADFVQLSQVMGIAQRMDDVVGAVRSPTVVVGDAHHLIDHPQVVHGHPTSAGMAGEQREQGRRNAVDPVELPGHPAPGLVEVHGIGLSQ